MCLVFSLRACYRFAVFSLCAAILLPAVAWAQSAVSVTDTSGWNPWSKADLSVMSDTIADQQTGQGQDDFASDANFGGFYQKAGTIGGVDSLLYRVRFDKFTATDQWGNGGNIGLGMDIDGDGALDLIMMMTEGSGNPANRTRTITWGDPGTGANVSPSTTTWTFPNTNDKINLVNDVTYDLIQANDGSNLNGTPDAFLSFAVSFADLQAAVRTYTPFTTFTMTYDTRISYIGFTSTQNNALNQDLFGVAGNNKGVTGNLSPSTTWADLGAMTGATNAWGIVPEPATYAQVGLMLLIGAVAYYRRKKSSKG